VTVELGEYEGRNEDGERVWLGVGLRVSVGVELSRRWEWVLGWR